MREVSPSTRFSRRGLFSKYELLFVALVVFMVAIEALARPALASERPGRAEIRRLIVGKTVSWNDGGGQSYYAVGGYYRYSRGARISEGTYLIADGVVCMKFKTGKARCDAWYRDGARYHIMTMKTREFLGPSRRFEVISVH